MSKHPSPRLDQLRALREAKYARKNEQRQPDADVPPAADAEAPPAADAEAPPAKTTANKKKSKKKAGRG
jgi:hypothetical protein